jgi:uncharacterized membrane protein YgaE (UPF0421/DUF939 family)
MELFLDLSRHCIETASQIQYERLIRQYFKKKPVEKEKIDIEQQISALKYFLSNANFYDLRNRFNNSNSIEKKATLVISEHFKDMYIYFNHTIYYPNWKTK